MGLGLGLLGRGGTRSIVPLWLLHIAGAAVAGALLGGLLGVAGSLLSLMSVRPWVVAGVVVVAVALAVRRRPLKLGRQRQVPRRWGGSMPPARAFFLWGALLGCGVATPIFYSGFVLLAGAQLTAGPLLGFASGAVFGAVREATAMFPVARRLGVEGTMDLLETLRPHARRLNAALVVAGGLVLVLASLG
jgi:hypothetical protein